MRTHTVDVGIARRSTAMIQAPRDRSEESNGAVCSKLDCPGELRPDLLGR